MKNFQIIVIIIFIALAVFGVLVFSGAIPLGEDAEGGSGTVVLWGAVKTAVMAPLLEEFNNANQNFTLAYAEKSAETFDQELLEALAEGRGPDMFLLPDSLAFHYANKIFPIPYESYPVADFKNDFAGAGEVFLTSRGILAFPLSIDPLVMYYSRSILDASGVIYPPATWDELSALTLKFTVKDEANKIIRSAAALGHFSNVAHAKDILAAMFMQTGNPILSEKDGVFRSRLSASDPRFNLAPVLKFYTDFADPNKEVYSWNKSFPNSSEAFSREDLAFYFGYASELPALVARNPNQDFFVAPFPQTKGVNFKTTGGRVTGIALLSSSRNFNTAFLAASRLAIGDFAGKFNSALGLAPARRDLLAIKPKTGYAPIFYDSALYARSWLDPSDKDTDNIFRNMIDGVLSGSFTPASAVSDANAKLNLLLLK